MKTPRALYGARFDKIYCALRIENGATHHTYSNDADIVDEKFETEPRLRLKAWAGDGRIKHEIDKTNFNSTLRNDVDRRHSAIRDGNSSACNVEAIDGGKPRNRLKARSKLFRGN
jgi:hypothetical protein